MILGAVFPASAVFSQFGFAQEESDSQPVVSILQDATADAAFEKFAKLEDVASAWRSLDSAAMTDSALLFAEAERVLLRSHTAIKASDLFELATRVAIEKGDKASLERLAKAAEKIGDKEKQQLLSVALMSSGISRNVGHDLKSDNLETVLAVQAFQRELQSAIVARDKEQLASLGSGLEEVPLSEEHRAALKNAISTATNEIKDDAEADEAAQLLDGLGGVIRPVGEIKGPEGNLFVPIDLSNPGATAEEFSEALKSLEIEGASPVIRESEESPLTALEKPSRGGQEFAAWGAWPGSGYGLTSIWSYNNEGGIYPDRCCGQAAMATMFTHLNPKGYAKTTTPNIVRRIENVFPPDGLTTAFKIGTSWQQMERIAKNYGFKYYWIYGEAELRKHVAAKKPVVVMLDVATNRAGGNFQLWNGIGGHWTVIYAYDNKNNYYPTNWGNGADVKISRTRFMKGWGYDMKDGTWPPNSPLTFAAGTTGKGLVLYR